jgi:hypothetical protein
MTVRVCHSRFAGTTQVSPRFATDRGRHEQRSHARQPADRFPDAGSPPGRPVTVVWHLSLVDRPGT